MCGFTCVQVRNLSIIIFVYIKGLNDALTVGISNWRLVGSQKDIF
jgi:hypothetical protein